MDLTKSEMAVDQVVQKLEADIVLGRLRPRERLLEVELAKHFNAKRHVIRAALLELETMGIVVREPHRGATVRDFTPDEVKQIYDLRQLLECHAAAIMPLPASKEVVAELTEIYDRHSDAVDKQELHAIFKYNLDFHRTLFAASGNLFLAKQIDQLASRVHSIRFISDNKIISNARKARIEHRLMIDYMRVGDRKKLVKIIALHIQPSRDAYLDVSRNRWVRR